MLVLFHPEATHEERLAVEQALRRHGSEPRKLHDGQRNALQTDRVPETLILAMPGVQSVLHDAEIHPLVRRTPTTPTRVVTLRDSVTVGDGSLCVIAGPCAVESSEQIEAIAASCAALGILVLRGGAFKPRTSPYSFRGAGDEALVWMRNAADRYGLAIVSEVMEPAKVESMAAVCDMLQVGSRNMQNFALLTALGRARRPVLLKRGMSATLEEWLLAAEHIAQSGNPDVVLCERGVRHFDPAVRNLLDLSAVPLLQERTNLPIVVDPSHGTGVRSAVGPMARAAVAAGCDGVMLEVHPDPGTARSDGFQALTLPMLTHIVPTLRRIHAVVSTVGDATLSG